MRWLVLGLLLTAACPPPVRWVRHRAGDRVQVLEEDERWCVEVLGAKPMRRCHEGLAIETMVVRPEGVAYAANDDGGWRVFAVTADGLESHGERRWRGIAELRLTPAGAPAYVAEDERGWWVRVGDEDSGPWPAVLAGSLQVHAEGYAFVSEDEAGKRVVVDGRASRPWDAVGHLRLVHGRALFLAQEGEEAFVHLGGALHGPYRRVTEVVEDGRVAGWVAMRDDGYVAVVEGRPTGPFSAVRGLLFEPRGFAHAFVASGESSERVIVDGEPGPAHEAIGELAFLGRGRLIYAARDQGAWWLYLDDHRWGPFEAIDDVAAGGDRWAAVVRVGEGVAVWVDGGERSRADWVSDLVVRRHGVAYLAGRGGRREVVVDHEAYPFPMVMEHSLVLDEEGRRWGCVVLDADGSRPRIVVDGVREHPLRIDDLASATVGLDPLELVSVGGALIRAEVRAAMGR